MKKVFEFLLILIIFYGVYTAFEKVLPIFKKDIQGIWIIFSAFIVSALLIILYRFMVKMEVSKDLKSHIRNLKHDLEQRDSVIKDKDDEIKAAKTFKHDLITEAIFSEPIE